MKKILFIVLIFFICPLMPNALELNSKNVILYNLNENKIIFDQNSEDIIPIASLTKITTAIIAIENISSLDNKIIIKENMLKGLVEINASLAGFKLGERVTYRDLLYGTLFPSGADATRALAISISGSENNFVNLMNAKANQLGMKNTHYANSSGLDDPNNYSTVKDVAIMLQYALQNPTFKEIFTNTYYITNNGTIQMASPSTRNSQRYNMSHAYILGSKTGYTPIAGYCLASIANSNGVDYMLVTAGANAKSNKPLNFIDAVTIYDYYIDNYEYRTILEQDEVITNLNINNEDYPIKATEKINYYLPKAAVVTYEYLGEKEISNSLKKDEKIGTLIIKSDGVVIDTIDVFLPFDLNLTLLSMENEPTRQYVLIGVVILMLIMFIVGRRKNIERGNLF